jgi:polyisoprenoid-binding protein YceI
MKKNILLGAGVVLLVLLILFVILKPKAPDFGSIAVVTENDNAIIPLPELSEDISRYRVQPGSQLLRTGRKIGGFHYGTVDVSQGAIVLDDAGEVVAGKFIINMDSIAITDMSSDNPLYNQLLDHLRDGFFAVDEYPSAGFDLKKAEKKS